ARRTRPPRSTPDCVSHLGSVVQRSEPVSDARLGDDIARIEWVRLDFPPDVGDVDAKVLLRVAELSARPGGGEELSMGHRLAGVGHKDAQQLPLGWCQMDRLAALGKSARLEIHLQLPVNNRFAANGPWRARSTL